MVYIKADRFFYTHEIKGTGYLEIRDGRFGQWHNQVPDGAEIIDYTGYQIAPGLVDTHIHGYGGEDVMDADHQGILEMSYRLLETGVTSFLPTTLTSSSEDLSRAASVISQVAGTEKGAKIQGIYFEGPYFTEEFKGAQNASYMRDPNIEEFDIWQKAAQGLIKKIALAPERQGATEFIKAMRERGVTVALGHSNATYDQAKVAVESGASIWVHAYNGMRGLTHREPGMVGAVYNLENTFAELISDGYHVNSVAMDILIKQKGYDHIALITDCMAAGGQPDGYYKLGEYSVLVKGGTARLKDGGNLAGSILKLKDGLKNVINWGLASPAEAINMASYIPAKSVNIDDVCGQLTAGYPADFIVLDEEFNLLATYVNGQKGWEDN